MTYVELIVVLGIFSVMSAVIMFNYGEFQAKVDIKNLASDIASKIVQAQKSAVNGVLPPLGFNYSDTWKPSYGVYFANTRPLEQFIYFTNTNDGISDNDYYDSGEEIDTPLITKNNRIVGIDKCSSSPCNLNSDPIESLSVTFRRPDSSAIFTTSPGETFNGSNYVQITIQSPKTANARIKIYPSGRVQVN